MTPPNCCHGNITVGISIDGIWNLNTVPLFAHHIIHDHSMLKTKNWAKWSLRAWRFVCIVIIICCWSTSTSTTSDSNQSTISDPVSEGQEDRSCQLRANLNWWSRNNRGGCGAVGREIVHEPQDRFESWYPVTELSLDMHVLLTCVYLCRWALPCLLWTQRAQGRQRTSSSNSKSYRSVNNCFKKSEHHPWDR